MSTQAIHQQRAFLYAHPAGHSLSPLMHNAAFAAAGLRAHYEALDIAPTELQAALERLRAPGVLGANLSLPHKEAALPFMDSLSEAARAIGAVNTVINVDGRLHGDNTDAPGFLRALKMAGDTGQIDTSQGAAVVLGAGGAARSAVWALRSQGLGSQALGSQARRVYVLNRTHERAYELTRDLGGEVASAATVPWHEVGLLVNASSAGLNNPEQTPLPGFDFAALPREALVYDMVYKPAQTRLMREAALVGLCTENGLGMLAWQAQLAFELWTGELESGRSVGIQVFLDALGQGLPKAGTTQP